MGFTAAAIVAPNVPTGLDPLTYFTAKPRDKAQELAQQQAQAAGLALFGGPASSSAALAACDDAEDATNGSQALKKHDAPSLSAEEKQAAQDAKTCVIPRAAVGPPKGAPSQSLDYTYLFPNAKLRTAPQLLGEAETAATEPKPRQQSSMASTPAPIIRPTLEELTHESPLDFIQKIKAQYGDLGLVKIVPPQGFHRERLPFGQDISGFKCEKQVFMSATNAESFNEQALRKGFFRAVLRFHATAPVDKGKRRLQKLPTFERKPVDLYRLFRCVRVRGGLEAVVKRKEWAQIGRELGYASQALPTLSSTLRQAYLRALQPFEIFLEQNGVRFDPHILPRLDVEDEDRPAKPRKGVRVLPNGIVVDDQDNKIATRERRVVVLDESRNQGPSHTLKSFRQKAAASQLPADADLSLDEREAAYWSVPAYYETEHLADSPGIRLLPFPAPTAANQLYATSLDKSHHPWRLSSLPLHDDALARHIHEDVDDFIIPRLHIGQQFATQDWQTAEMAAYTLVTLVDGSPRTWYTKNGVFTDQHAGELVVIFPNTRTMNWCHGYSVTESVSLFPGFDWLERAVDPEIMNKSMQFCVQRLIYEASQSALNPKVQKQVLIAIQYFKERELAILGQLGHIRRAKPEPALGSRSITCAITGAKRHWSWVLVDGETWSPEAVLKSRPTTSNLVLVTRYDEASQFFDDMVQAIKIKSRELREWRQTVTHALRGDKLPEATLLAELLQTAPDTMDDKRVAGHLSWTIESMQKWLASYENSQLKKWEALHDAYNEQIGCLDNNGVIESMSMRTRTMANEHSVEDLWNGLVASLKAGVVPDAAIYGQLESLMSRHAHLRTFMQTLRQLTDWVSKAARKAREVPVDFNELLALKEQGIRLKVPVSTDAMRAIEQQLNWGLQNLAEVDRLMLDRGAFDGSLIRHYQKIIDVNTLQTETRDRFLTLVLNLGLIDRMAGPDLLKRPQRREAEVLNAFPAFAYAVNDLNVWLANAQSLDWLLIIGQLQKLATSAPDPYTGQRISTSQLMTVRKQMYELRIVPDDIALVQKTIEESASALDAAPPEKRATYGFDP